MNTNDSLMPIEVIQSKIYLIRGQKVMLDRDLAKLYDVKTHVLKQSVKRNMDRFPEDFMFELTKEELKNWSSQFVSSNSSDKMGLRYPPFAFTEQGIAMLSSVLRSKRAINVNIQIMRTFTKLRQMLISNAELKEKIESIEKKYDKQFQIVFQAIKELINKDVNIKPKQRIGFIKK